MEDLDYTDGGDASDDPSEDSAGINSDLNDFPISQADPGALPADGLPVAHGDAERELVWAQQQTENGLCVPTSVAMVVSEFFGDSTDPHFETEVAAAAVDMGLLEYDGEQWTGMTAGEAQELLEHYNIASTVSTGTVADLDRYLDDGRDIILAIDSSEIWEGVSDDTSPRDTGADHAVVITEVDEARGIVTLNDPGHPKGAGAEVTIDQLEDAWADSGNQMVVTAEAPSAGMSEAPSDPDEQALPTETPVPATAVQQFPSESVDAVAQPAPFAQGAVILPILLAGGIAVRALGKRT